jgi:nucleotide-binding universal stress UspA family protein
MLKKILAALDGSRMSESILPYVELILASQDADVTLARVTPEGTDEEEKAARAYLSDVALDLRKKGAVVDTAVLAGNPADAILEQAVRGGYSLILMATRGRSGLGKLIFGSTAEEILERSPIPVFAAHPRGKNAPAPRITKIVVPLDGSHRSGSILKALSPMARALGARVLVLTIVSPRGREVLPVELVAKNILAEQKELEAAGIRTEMIVRYGDPATEILAAGALEEHTLVALSTHGRTGLDKVLFGSVAEKVLRQGAFPMLVVRTAAIPKTQGTGRAAMRARSRALRIAAGTPGPSRGKLG